jgi:hypothetical protein
MKQNKEVMSWSEMDRMRKYTEEYLYYFDYGET